LAGKGQSVKRFIRSLRMSGPRHPSVVGSLFSKLTGKSGDQLTHYRPDELIVVEEIVPWEVIRDLDNDPGKDTGTKLVKELVADHALRFQLGMDTVAGRVSAEPTSDADHAASAVDEMLVRYVGRLVAPQTKEHYDLGLVATADAKLARRLAE